MSTTWAEVTFEAPGDLIDQLADFLVTLSGNGICIENLDLDTFSLDTVEDTPVKTVKTYFTSDASLQDKIDTIESYLSMHAAAYPGFVPHPPAITHIQEEDWANNWKKHFRPSRVGQRIVIKPTWEEWDGADDAIILELDPGMAFGTGTHPTSRLCLEILERIFFHEAPFSDPDSPLPADLLDVGTGSGILAIAAAKLGAGRVTAMDHRPQSGCHRSTEPGVEPGAGERRGNGDAAQGSGRPFRCCCGEYTCRRAGADWPRIGRETAAERISHSFGHINRK